MALLSIPAHLMAAARLSTPSILVPCGYQLWGKFRGREVDIEAVGIVCTGAMKVEELEGWTLVAIQGPGVCAGLATANSMHILGEVLGMAMPGTTPVRAGNEKLFQNARRAGRRIIEMVAEQLLPRQILTLEAFRNAVAAATALGASVNTVRHLAGHCDRSRTRPRDHPPLRGSRLDRGSHCAHHAERRGPHRAFDAAGGTCGAMKQLKKTLRLSAVNVTGKTLGEPFSGQWKWTNRSFAR
jgi:dihydroxy-acid dehydratase